MISFVLLLYETESFIATLLHICHTYYFIVMSWRCALYAYIMLSGSQFSFSWLLHYLTITNLTTSTILDALALGACPGYQGSDVLSERLKSAPMEGHWTISRFAVNQSPICRLIEVRLRHDSLCGCEL